MVLRQLVVCFAERSTFSVLCGFYCRFTVTQTKETPQNSGSPSPFLRRLRGSLLRLRSMMRLEAKPVAREWHLRGNQGHDGLITAGYRSSHSCGYATASGARLSRHFKDGYRGGRKSPINLKKTYEDQAIFTLVHGSWHLEDDCRPLDVC